MPYTRRHRYVESEGTELQSPEGRRSGKVVAITMPEEPRLFLRRRSSPPSRRRSPPSRRHQRSPSPSSSSSELSRRKGPNPEATKRKARRINPVKSPFCFIIFSFLQYYYICIFIIYSLYLSVCYKLLASFTVLNFV